MKKIKTKISASKVRKPRPPVIGDSVWYDPVGSVRAGREGVVVPGILVAINGSRAKTWSWSCGLGAFITDVEYAHLLLDRTRHNKISKKELSCVQAALKPGPIGAWFFARKRDGFRECHDQAIGEIDSGLSELMREYRFGPDTEALLKRNRQIVTQYKSDLRGLYGAILERQLAFTKQLEASELVASKRQPSGKK